ncbi:TPA: signal peptidase I [bacterium]|nr:signal peptidase I [bacterium]
MKLISKKKRLVIIICLLVMIISIIIIRNYIIEIAVISGASMEPTFMQGDHVIINRLAYKSKKPEKNDIIAVKTGWLMIVKRVFGVTGDVVELKGNKLFINSNLIKLDTDDEHTLKRRNFGPSIISDHHVFVMGDNPDHSIDSRDYGMIKYEEIYGKVFMIYFPVKRIKIL